MSSKLDQLTGWLKERKITEVECLISDLTGIASGKISPTNKFLDEKGMRLPESVLLQTVTGDYVEDDIYYELLDPPISTCSAGPTRTRCSWCPGPSSPPPS